MKILMKGEILDLPNVSDKAISEMVSFYVRLMEKFSADYGDAYVAHEKTVKYILQVQNAFELPFPIWEYMALRNQKEGINIPPLQEGYFRMRIEGVMFDHLLPSSEEICVLHIELLKGNVKVESVTTGEDFLSVFNGQLFVTGEGRQDLDIPVSIETVDEIKNWSCPKGQNQLGMYIASVNSCGQLTFWSGSIDLDDMEVIIQESEKVEVVLDRQH